GDGGTSRRDAYEARAAEVAGLLEPVGVDEAQLVVARGRREAARPRVVPAVLVDELEALAALRVAPGGDRDRPAAAAAARVRVGLLAHDAERRGRVDRARVDVMDRRGRPAERRADRRGVEVLAAVGAHQQVALAGRRLADAPQVVRVPEAAR